MSIYCRVHVRYKHQNNYVPGQQLLHETLVIFSPKQSLPPQLGLGLVHVRCWIITPSPQVTEQCVPFFQSLHPPSTKNGKHLYTP